MVNIMDDTIKHINGRPIWWQDGQGTIHVCKGADVHRNVRLFWTLCEKDVPANTAFHPGDDDRVTCNTCLAKSSGEQGG